VVFIKKVTNADTGNADVIGGDDWDLLQDYYDDVNQDSSRTAKINTKTRFQDQKLQKLNPAGTFTGTELNPPLTANRDLEYGYSSYANYIVYKDLGSLTFKVKGGRLNDVITNTSIPEDAIQAALDAGGAYSTVKLRDTTYPLSGAFTGFTTYYNQHIDLGVAQIVIPNGYTGSVFKVIDTSTNHFLHVYGGLFSEAGTPARDWTCFDLMSTTTTGLASIMITGTRIVNAKRGIALRTDTNGWVNASQFIGLFFDLCEIGAEWIFTGVYTDGASGCNNNTFLGCTHQGTTGTTHGFKDVNGRRNSFINCYPADFTGAQITCNITANARSTVIEGGSTTYANFDDQEPAGFKAIINDEWQGNVAYKRTTSGYHDQVAVSAPASPSTGTIRKYTKTIDANNDGQFYKARINGAVVEVQI
jgi:hypothetical protein